MFIAVNVFFLKIGLNFYQKNTIVNKMLYIRKRLELQNRLCDFYKMTFNNKYNIKIIWINSVMALEWVLARTCSR